MKAFKNASTIPFAGTRIKKEAVPTLQQLPAYRTNISCVIIPGGTLNPCYINTTDAVAVSIQVRNGGTVRAISNQVLKVNGKCLTLPPN